MEINPYKGGWPDVTKLLHKEGVLTRYPAQHKAMIEYDEGIDIVYTLKNLPPKKFEQVADLLLLAAVTEAKRYPMAKYYFARLEVRLNRTEKGKSKAGPTRWYTAQKHDDPDVMVYGEEALGYSIPEGFKKPFLLNKVKEILSIPDSPSPGAFVRKQKPYVVSTLIISMRAGANKVMDLPEVEDGPL